MVVVVLVLVVSKQRLGGAFNATEVFINWLDVIQETFIKEHIKKELIQQ